jgi:hypothetical protein
MFTVNVLLLEEAVLADHMRDPIVASRQPRVDNGGLREIARRNGHGQCAFRQLDKFHRCEELSITVWMISNQVGNVRPSPSRQVSAGLGSWSMSHGLTAGVLPSSSGVSMQV